MERTVDHEVLGSYPESGFSIDRTRWPLVTVRVGRTFTAEEFGTLYDRSMEESAARGDAPYLSLVDARALPVQAFAGVLRATTISLLNRHQARARGRLLAEVIVHDAFLARGTFAVVRRAYRPQWPLQFFTTVEDAERFCWRVWREGERSGAIDVAGLAARQRQR
ncbi:MAG: hypothetical protein H6724_00530 [Sandaracinus sp.]|nr:hypothetical protein [Sandaracinus sp.]MCB9617916.1 hypothetical protein [Sandaracinus sp.]MCB9623699.1 hypothetical protein [Sandaracinus sp.]